MHIRQAELGQPGPGRQNESSSGRKLRLGGGASRVPINSQTTDSPLRVLVTAIGQSLGSRTQLRGQNAGSKTPSAAKTSLFSSAAKNSSTGQNSGSKTPSAVKTGLFSSASKTSSVGQNTGSKTPSATRTSLFSSASKTSSASPADSRKNASSLLGRLNASHSSAARSTGMVNSSTGPATPASSRIPATPASSRIPSTPASSRIPSTPASSRIPSTPASSRIPSTPASSRIPSTPASSRIPSTPASSRIPSTPTSSRIPSTPALYGLPSTPTSSRIPSTPGLSRMQAIAATPSRRNSLSSSSSSSSSLSSSNAAKKESISSSSYRKATATLSTSSRTTDPSTPVPKNLSMPPRTPKALNNPTTPLSNESYTPHPPSARRPVVTPGAKQPISTPQTRSKSFFPTTPVSKNMSGNSTTPAQGLNGFSTPLSSQHSANLSFYTPNSTLPLTPLQPKNFNIPESSRRLHFGINVAAMVDQENLGLTTPRPYTATVTEATFSFDKDRLAQIKARRNASGMLKSPARRIRVQDQQHPPRTPGGGLQQVAEDRSSSFDEGVLVHSLNQSPAKRRVANALF